MSFLRTFVIAWIALLVAVQVTLQPHEPNAYEVAIPSHFTSKVLIYITTIYSDTHRRYLRCCWPRLLSESRLFQKAHFIMFSNNMTALDENYLSEVKQMFLSSGVTSFEFKFADGTRELEVLTNFTRQEEVASQKSKRVAKLIQAKSTAKQWGANMAMSVAVSSGWFQPYDWIVRLNPDVLIRQSDFIVDHLDDSSVDAIVARCDFEKIDTDFFAVRPQALQPNAFAQMYPGSMDKPVYEGMSLLNHEVTAKKNFLPILFAKRFLEVPNLARMKMNCRVRGDKAPVYHAHDSKSCLKPLPLLCQLKALSMLYRWFF